MHTQGLRSAGKATDRSLGETMICALALGVALLSARPAVASHCRGGMACGAGGDDTITGSSCDDIIVGNDGNNDLTGLVGHDLFVFSTGCCLGLDWNAGWFQPGPPSSCFPAPSQFFPGFGVSEIQDFTRGFDRITLDKATFSSLKSEIGLGLSDPTDFDVVDSDAAVDADPALIVYSVESEMLFYNENGSAAGRGQGDAFAHLPGVDSVAPSDFQVIDWTPSSTTTTTPSTSTTNTTLLPSCATIADCEGKLGSTLPNPASAENKKAKRIAAKLHNLSGKAATALSHAAASSGKKQRNQHKTARKLLLRLLVAAQHADAKGTLDVPLAPLQAAVNALLAQVPS